MMIKEMMRLLSEDLEREKQHLGFYLHSATSVTGLDNVRDFFKQEASGEMLHVELFQSLLEGLSLRRKIAIPQGKPLDFMRHTDPRTLLDEALRMEDEVVSNYVERINQAIVFQQNGEDDEIDGKWIELFLENQLTDSRTDADKIRKMIAEYK